MERTDHEHELHLVHAGEDQEQHINSSECPCGPVKILPEDLNELGVNPEEVEANLEDIEIWQHRRAN